MCLGGGGGFFLLLCSASYSKDTVPMSLPDRPLSAADLTSSRGRKIMGSVKVMPGLSKMGRGMTVKKNLVLGGLQERAGA